MFTSRAEHRLLLREDNADLRLTPAGRELGVVDDNRWRNFDRKRAAVTAERERIGRLVIHPRDVPRDTMHRLFGEPLAREYTALELLRRPGVSYEALAELKVFGSPGLRPDAAEQVEIQAKYDGYIKRQREEIERNLRFEGLPLPDDLDYSSVRGLSHEVCQKLQVSRPSTLGQASRIPGVTPAAVSLLLVHLKRGGVLGQPDSREASSA
jgi:tRNA uridine 5-carboxymethylaminomethyl modification enzyme